ncbi:bZIP transcription factor 50, partial [Mucuna pruriens]
MDSVEETLFDQLDWESFLEDLPVFDDDDFLQDDTVPVSVADNPFQKNTGLSEIENLLMTHDENDVALPETPSYESDDYYKLLEEILVEPEEGPESQRSKTESEEVSGKDRTDDADAAPDEPMSKKLKRQLRNRDAAVKSRERKKLYVKNLEMKSRYLEGECRRLGHLLQCCYAENNALRLCLQSRGAFGASMTMQESAVLLLEPLLLGSLLWFMGITCHLSLPLMLWFTTAVLPRKNTEHEGLRRVTQKGPESKISECFQMQSVVKSRRCRASRTKMKVWLLLENPLTQIVLVTQKLEIKIFITESYVERVKYFATELYSKLFASSKYKKHELCPDMLFILEDSTPTLSIHWKLIEVIAPLFSSSRVVYLGGFSQVVMLKSNFYQNRFA